MRSGLSRVLMVGLSASLLFGCAPAAAVPTPTTGTAVSWQVTPIAAFYTPAPATPTRTPVPVPPTPTPSATPAPNAALALLQQATTSKQEVKSSRLLLEMRIEGQEGSKPVLATVTIEGESAGANTRLHLAMAVPKGLEGLEDSEVPLALDVEVITVGDTSYMRTGDEWSAYPGGTSSLKEETNVLDTAEMEALLARATAAKVVGRRTVKGVECDVVSLALPYKDLLDLASLGGGGLDTMPSQDVRFDVFDTEVAVGVADKVVHQLVLTMGGGSTSNQADRFAMTMTMTVWDVNSPDIVIKAPANVKPAATP